MAPEYTFMGLHEVGSGWVAVFLGRVGLIGFWDLLKALAESCISHWMVDGSWQQEAKSPKVKKTKFGEIQKIEMSSRMGEVVDGRQKQKHQVKV